MDERNSQKVQVTTEPVAVEKDGVDVKMRSEFATALRGRNLAALTLLQGKDPSNYMILVKDVARQISEQIESRRKTLSVDDEMRLRNGFADYLKAFPGVNEVKAKTREEVIQERGASRVEETLPAKVETFEQFKVRMASGVAKMSDDDVVVEARRLLGKPVFLPGWFSKVAGGTDTSLDGLKKLREWFMRPDIGEISAVIDPPYA